MNSQLTIDEYNLIYKFISAYKKESENTLNNMKKSIAAMENIMKTLDAMSKLDNSIFQVSAPEEEMINKLEEVKQIEEVQINKYLDELPIINSIIEKCQQINPMLKED